jgi:hypothetical protein
VPNEPCFQGSSPTTRWTVSENDSWCQLLNRHFHFFVLLPVRTHPKTKTPFSTNMNNRYLLNLCTAALFAGVADAATYVAANDFSTTNNPNGVWQYGLKTTLGSPFILLDTPTRRGTDLDFWTNSNNEPSVFHNANATPTSAFSDFTLQPNQTAFHPGQAGEFSIFRWTAPNDGTYALHADFVGLGSSSTPRLIFLSHRSSYAPSWDSCHSLVVKEKPERRVRT